MQNRVSVQAATQNLKDAGCDSETIEQYFLLDESGEIQEQLELLSAHRGLILENIHKEEKQIGCLDYLVYQLGKKMKTTK